MTFDVDAIKAGHRAAWAGGDYERIAELTAAAVPALVDGCAISAGQEVLDVAAGTGNVALAAAREGAAVVACDITPELLERGRAKAEAEGLDVEWVEADAEALPFEDGRFDAVVSAFGAIFAPRPHVVAGELFRVARPGGTVGMANWTPESFPARTFTLATEYLPPPEGLEPMPAWGDEEVVAERLGPLASSLHTERRSARWEIASPEALAELFERHSGMHAVLMRGMGERYAEYRTRWLEEIARSSTPAGDGLLLEAEYLLVVARRRG